MNDDEEMIAEWHRERSAWLMAEQRKQVRRMRWAFARSLTYSMAMAMLGTVVGQAWQERDWNILASDGIAVACVLGLFWGEYFHRR